MATDLSIVVVHWNVPDLLAACLRSIEDERERCSLSIQTIVVDNASPDRGYVDVMRRFPRTELIEILENRGYAAGCNTGIARSQGEAIFLLNPDTKLLPGALDALWNGLHVASHVGMVAPLLLNPDGSLQSAGYRFPGIVNVVFDFVPVHPRLVESPMNGRIPPGDGVQPVQVDYPLGAAMMVRRVALDAVGVLDETYGMYSEEIDWAQRFARAGWTILLVPRARVVHHGGQSTGQLQETMRESLWRSRAMYHGRWTSPGKRRVINRLVAIGTRFDDLRAGDARRRSNARIREAFRTAGAER